ncbi:unnamed protein product [Arctia plantaginis]|uniref:Uncharacterized protein n=1 Tax=Arctia plantaginis TaxID=874455 RepID=A0A8S1AP35_ARCPL|nr:unnamed protein product [Arctia plantaginis]
MVYYFFLYSEINDENILDALQNSDIDYDSDVSDNDPNYQPQVDNRNRTFNRNSTSVSSSDDDPPSPEVAPSPVLSASSMRATLRVRRGRSDRGVRRGLRIRAMTSSSHDGIQNQWTGTTFDPEVRELQQPTFIPKKLRRVAEFDVCRTVH